MTQEAERDQFYHVQPGMLQLYFPRAVSGSSANLASMQQR
jgi:hypothetical protein